MINTKAVSGSDWMPFFDQGGQQIGTAMTASGWTPKGDWNITMEYFQKGYVPGNTHYPLLVFYDETKASTEDDYKGAALVITDEGTLIPPVPSYTLYLYEDVKINGKINSVDSDLKDAKVVAKVADKLNFKNLCEITIGHRATDKTCYIGIDGDLDYGIHENMSQYPDIMIGMWLQRKIPSSASGQTDKLIVGSCGGQITEISFEDEADQSNSRLYDFILHSDNSSLPATRPTHFIDHLHPTSEAHKLPWVQQDGTALNENWWQEMDPLLIYISGPDTITGPGMYVYDVSHAFDEKQEVSWNTAGTILEAFAPFEQQVDGKWHYGCSFRIEDDKYLDTRVHLYVTFKNLGTASRTIGDLREPAIAPADLRADFSTVPAYGKTITLPVSLTDQKMVLDPFALSNFTTGQADVKVKVYSSDKEWALKEYTTLTANKIELPYVDFIEKHYIYGTGTEVLVRMEVFKKGGMAFCDPLAVVEKKYFFDKSALHLAAAGKLWSDSDAWDDVALWEEEIN